MTKKRAFFFIAIFSLLIPNAGGTEETNGLPSMRPFPYPENADLRTGKTTWKTEDQANLEKRETFQVALRAKFPGLFDFHFSDRAAESGITFRNEIVDDAGKDYKAVHYDHGTGLAAADVDGDGLTDLYFVSQLGENELWRNLGNGKFENITSRAGVGMRDRVSVGASFADIDNDGDPDLFVTTVRKKNALFENLGNGVFRDISHAAGVDYSGHSSGSVFFDYDRNGLLDLFVANVGIYTTNERGRGGYFVGIPNAGLEYLKPGSAEKSLLFENLGGKRFQEASEKMGLADLGWSGDVSLTDFNGDLFPDLYVLNMSGNDHYYENDAGNRFVDKTSSYFAKTPWGSMGIKSFDYNNDGLLDLFITDMHSDMSRVVRPEEEKLKANWVQEAFPRERKSIWGNAFYRNLGRGRFMEISDRINLETFWPWGISVGDLNADGYEDVFITAGMSYPFRYGINSLLLNNRGITFVDSEFLVGVEPRKGGRTETEWFTLDCSGEDRDRPECKDCSAGSRDLLMSRCRQKEGRVSVLGTLGSRSSVILDLDNDGDLDIVTSNFNSTPQVLINDLAQRKRINYLKIMLVGTISNRDGLGATVNVFSGPNIYVKFNDGKSGYLSQSSIPLYFGLGTSQSVNRIEITWPSGRKQTLEGPISSNQILKIVEK
jgi:enediyne biosynthesis protein E4